MTSPSIRAERLIRRYFAMCNAGDSAGLQACFTSDAVHWFPPGLPGVPWRGPQAIAEGWCWCVDRLGSKWTIEKVLCSVDGREAVVEWTHWKTAMNEVLRGDEWYIFNDDVTLIREIRAYYASPVDKTRPVNEIHEFEYAARGYHTAPPVVPGRDR